MASVKVGIEWHDHQGVDANQLVYQGPDNDACAGALLAVETIAIMMTQMKVVGDVRPYKTAIPGT